MDEGLAECKQLRSSSCTACTH